MNPEFEFYQEFCCSAEGAVKYRIRFISLERPKGWRSSIREMVVERSLDDGFHWQKMPLSLSFRSRLLLWTSAAPEWPPEVPVRMGCENYDLWFEYVDAPDVNPRWARKHSLWCAKFSQGKERWEISRVKYIQGEENA